VIDHNLFQNTFPAKQSADILGSFVSDCTCCIAFITRTVLLLLRQMHIAWVVFSKCEWRKRQSYLRKLCKNK